jgi:hypothetical protein
VRIWVDADGCPGATREILFRAAARTGVELVLVANQPVRVPRGGSVRTLQVPQGFDVADSEIVRQVAAGDLVVTSDIPLAAEAIERGALALSPRGELYDRGNIRARLSMRDFMDTLRASGVDTGGPPPMTQADRKAFADQLDRLLARAAPGPAPRGA